MKQYYIIILLFLIGNLSVQSQESVCLNDSISLQTEDFRGELTWQKSINGEDWSQWESEAGRILELVPQTSMYYRYEIIEGTCAPIYSDIIEIIVNQLPVVLLQSIDSVCENLGMFQLGTGSPSGGQYRGTGIIDGRFIPNLAGAGEHTYFYSFADTLTTCTDSTQATITVLPMPSEANAGVSFPEIMQDSIQLQATNPEAGEGLWSIIAGGTGTFSDLTDPQAWFKKGADSTNYTLQWTVANSCGNNSDQIDLKFLRLSLNPCPGTPVVFDTDGNMYPTIQIGDQCWMAENLKAGTTITSTIASRAHSNASNNGVVERYTMENDENNIALYGGLYDWDEMMGYSETEGDQGICPDGWHVPSVGEYDTLNKFYKDNDAGDHLKEGGDSGFEGKLVGDRHSTGSFVSQGSSGFFWTSSSWTYNGANEGWVRELCACNNSLDRIHFNKKTGASVRCIKNE